MKVLAICFTIISIAFVSLGQNIDTIKVYYLPWELKTKKALKAEDVRNFNNGLNHYYEIVNDSSIIEFDNAVNIFNFTDTSLFKLIDVRMVLDFILSDGNIFTIEIGSPSIAGGKIRTVKFLNSYFDNIKYLNNTVDKNIPEMLTLKGTPIRIRSPKGEHSSEQIEEFRKKGVIIEEIK